MVIPPDFALACIYSLNQVPTSEQRAVFDKFGPESGLAFFQLFFWMLDATGATVVATEKVNCPVLCLSGADDKMVSLLTARATAAAYRGAPFWELQGHGHMLLVEPGADEIAERIAALDPGLVHSASSGSGSSPPPSMQPERALDRREGAAVMDAHAVLLDGRRVLRRAVALVAVPGIAPIAPRSFTINRSRVTLATIDAAATDSDRPSPPTTARALQGKRLRNDVAVDQRGADRHAEPAIGRAHAPQARLQDVDAVDALDRSDHDRHERGGDDLSVAVLARLRRQHFRNRSGPRGCGRD